MRLVLPLLIAAFIPLLAACGAEQEPAPRAFEAKPPRGERRVEFPAAGMTMVRPRNWQLKERKSPGVFELLSGEVTIAAWAYLRDEPLPETEEQLEAAKDRLVEAIEERDPEFALRSAVTTEVGESPAIDVRGDQVIARRRLATRSVHVFEGDVEYVFEVLSPPADYPLASDRVLEPLLGSLELEGEVREDEG